MVITKYKTIYFVGIKGVGMTALSIVAKEMGKQVVGVDVAVEFETDNLLLENDVTVHKGFDPSHIDNLAIDNDLGSILVVTTGAHGGSENIEAKRAKELNIPVLSHGKALGLFMSTKRGVSVAGTHGKTTTSAMIAHVLTNSKKDPSYVVGAPSIVSLGASGHFGRGEWFVAEADEYMADPKSDKTPRFLYQYPEIGIITSIDFDHPDAFSSIDDVKSAFSSFIENIDEDGVLILGIDNKNCATLKKDVNVRTITYGYSKKADIYITSYAIKNNKSVVTVEYKKKKLVFNLQIPGKHNVANACATIATCFYIGLSWNQIRDGLQTFAGTKRRFELIREKDGIRYYDDYAHHPEEIATTLSAVRDLYPDNRIVVVFQPHTYSRTKSLINHFARCFSSADVVFVADIFVSARETKKEGISSQVLVQHIKKYHENVTYSQHPSDVASALLKGDILFTMGAGDIYKWHEKL